MLIPLLSCVVVAVGWIFAYYYGKAAGYEEGHAIGIKIGQVVGAIQMFEQQQGKQNNENPS